MIKVAGGSEATAGFFLAGAAAFLAGACGALAGVTLLATGAGDFLVVFFMFDFLFSDRGRRSYFPLPWQAATAI